MNRTHDRARLIGHLVLATDALKEALKSARQGEPATIVEEHTENAAQAIAGALDALDGLRRPLTPIEQASKTVKEFLDE